MDARQDKGWAIEKYRPATISIEFKSPHEMINYPIEEIKESICKNRVSRPELIGYKGLEDLDFS